MTFFRGAHRVDLWRTPPFRLPGIKLLFFPRPPSRNRERRTKRCATHAPGIRSADRRLLVRTHISSRKNFYPVYAKNEILPNPTKTAPSKNLPGKADGMPEREHPLQRLPKIFYKIVRSRFPASDYSQKPR